MSLKFKLICSLAVGLSAVSYAVATPQTGTWLIGNGQNAYGGDIINIDAQDNKLFVIFAVGEVPNNTYFLYGRGTMDGDSVVLDLTSSKDLSVRRVTGGFDTSTTGVLNFPGVGQRSLYRVKLDDESNPASMIGMWSFSNFAIEGGAGAAQLRIFTSIIEGTADGNGIAFDGTQNFGCEYKVRGELQGYMLCVDTTNPSFLTAYILKRSANEAGGFYSRDGNITGTGLAHRLVSSDAKVSLVLKTGSEAQNIMRSAMQNFSYNYESLAKQITLRKKK